MKKTDYSKIAKIYDKNLIRRDIPPDLTLQEYIFQNPQEEYNVLDLACGTGNYLEVQVNYFKEKINWYGLDLSKEMINIAKSKVDKVKYSIGNAEDLPYKSETFDYISNNFAFHHFENKYKALDEMNRILKKSGILKIKTLSHTQMNHSWIYKYFPESYFEDLKRFWNNELIFYELKNRGFDVSINVDYKLYEVNLSEIYEDAKRGDFSQFSIISKEEYNNGIDKIKYELSKNQNAKVLNDIALLTCVAKKKK